MQRDLEEMEKKLDEVTNSSEKMNKFVHDRIDNVINSSADLSIALNTHKYELEQFKSIW